MLFHSILLGDNFPFVSIGAFHDSKWKHAVSGSGSIDILADVIQLLYTWSGQNPLQDMHTTIGLESVNLGELQFLKDGNSC